MRNRSNSNISQATNLCPEIERNWSESPGQEDTAGNNRGIEETEQNDQDHRHVTCRIENRARVPLR